MKKSLRGVFAALVLIGAGVGSANAAVITSTLPEFNGPFDLLPPYGTFAVGTFSFGPIAAGDIVSATISGSWGNSTVSSSSPANVLLDGIQVASCGAFQSCTFGGVDSWSYSFAAPQFSIFADGSAAFTAVQILPFNVRLGPTTLSITTRSTSVPEPATLALLGLGLAGLGLARRKRAA